MTETEGLPYRPCAGVMLINAEGRVFIGRRADRSEEGVGTWWQMPQGGLDEGEDPEVGARRELAEETGVTSVRFVARTRDWLTYDLPDELIGVAWEGRYRGQKQMWFAARFEGPIARSISARAKATSKSSMPGDGPRWRSCRSWSCRSSAGSISA